MTPLNLQYKVGIIQQTIQALRAVYKSPTFPDPELSQKINIEIEYPIIQTRFPAIYVTFNENKVIDGGLGNYTIEDDDSGTPHFFRQWIFEGLINFNIMALDPLERDTLSASLVDIFAFGTDMTAFQPFYDEIYDEDFVSLQLLHAHLLPGGNNISPAPWGNTDEFVYISSYGAATAGSFWTEPDNPQLVPINKIIPYPYTDIQAIPNPQPNNPNPWFPS